MVIPNGGALNRNMVPLTPSGLMSLGGVFFFRGVEKLWRKKTDVYQRNLLGGEVFCIGSSCWQILLLGFSLFWGGPKRGVLYGPCS